MTSRKTLVKSFSKGRLKKQAQQRKTPNKGCISTGRKGGGWEVLVLAIPSAGFAAKKDLKAAAVMSG